tara:strand:+ start:103 stop:441 length:339 start_codon:yes stop_codon:yes gene_type:complete
VNSLEDIPSGLLINPANGITYGLQRFVSHLSIISSEYISTTQYDTANKTTILTIIMANTDEPYVSKYDNDLYILSRDEVDNWDIDGSIIFWFTYVYLVNITCVYFISFKSSK